MRECSNGLGSDPVVPQLDTQGLRDVPRSAAPAYDMAFPSPQNPTRTARDENSCRTVDTKSLTCTPRLDTDIPALKPAAQGHAKYKRGSPR